MGKPIVWSKKEKQSKTSPGLEQTVVLAACRCRNVPVLLVSEPKVTLFNLNINKCKMEFIKSRFPKKYNAQWALLGALTLSMVV